MTYDPEIHHRRSIRLKEYDYSFEGAYFVTICTHKRECLFGDIADSEVRLNQYGSVVQECWEGLLSHYPHVYLNEFMIMPNHVHGIILLSPPDVDVGAGSPRPNGAGQPCPYTEMRHALGQIVAYLKYQSAKCINALRETPGYPVWQRNYYEHIIRNGKSFEAIQAYITANPLYWAKDPDNPVNIR